MQLGTRLPLLQISRTEGKVRQDAATKLSPKAKQQATRPKTLKFEHDQGQAAMGRRGGKVKF